MIYQRAELSGEINKRRLKTKVFVQILNIHGR